MECWVGLGIMSNIFPGDLVMFHDRELMHLSRIRQWSNKYLFSISNVPVLVVSIKNRSRRDPATHPWMLILSPSGTLGWCAPSPDLLKIVNRST
jgi:hypothetical protein